jgi:hypothetical protein
MACHFLPAKETPEPRSGRNRAPGEVAPECHKIKPGVSPLPHSLGADASADRGGGAELFAKKHDKLAFTHIYPGYPHFLFWLRESHNAHTGSREIRVTKREMSTLKHAFLYVAEQTQNQTVAGGNAAETLCRGLAAAMPLEGH